jgi:phosphomevalonate kinase
MRAMAPGKVMLTGAYVVLEGAPALVVAVDRYAVADSRFVDAHPSSEIRIAFGDAAAPSVDVRALYDSSGRKLGLGSSAAGLVAALGASALERGCDPREPSVREGIFRSARIAHARAQGGGSGVDVAASTYGGVLQYRMRGDEDSIVRCLDWPESLVLVVYDSGESARTSDLLSRVLSHRALGERAADYARLRALAERAAMAFQDRDVAAFIEGAREFGRGLEDLGRGADVPIVLPRFAELARTAADEAAAFIPSGAGGGDVAVWLSSAEPSPEFSKRASTLSMVRLPLSIDRGGVRPAFPDPMREPEHGANF